MKKTPRAGVGQKEQPSKSTDITVSIPQRKAAGAAAGAVVGGIVGGPVGALVGGAIGGMAVGNAEPIKKAVASAANVAAKKSPGVRRAKEVATKAVKSIGIKVSAPKAKPAPSSSTAKAATKKLPAKAKVSPPPVQAKKSTAAKKKS